MNDDIMTVKERADYLRISEKKALDLHLNAIDDHKVYRTVLLSLFFFSQVFFRTGVHIEIKPEKNRIFSKAKSIANNKEAWFNAGFFEIIRPGA